MFHDQYDESLYDTSEPEWEPLLSVLTESVLALGVIGAIAITRAVKHGLTRPDACVRRSRKTFRSAQSWLTAGL